MIKREAPPGHQQLPPADSVREASRARTRRPRRWWLLLVVAAVVGGYGLTTLPERSETHRRTETARPGPADTDGDGLPDELEKNGWITRDGRQHRTDPTKADTDNDGLWDGDEAGALVAIPFTGPRYVGVSGPTLPDTDRDGLQDADEADLGVDPYDADSDDDQIADGPEVLLVGTDPELADTDGDTFLDGFEDANKTSQGLDPLSVDIKVNKWTYAGDFAKGALAGDLWREDTLAWLAGNLTSGGSSSVPVVGSVLGAAADVRDTVGSAIHADWVGSGFSAVGAVPGGDLVAVPGKAARFAARNPELLAATAAIVAASTKLPETVKVRAAKALWKEDWDHLVKAGASQKALLALQTGRKPLGGVADALKRPGYVNGEPARFFATGKDGESFLESLYGAKTKGVNTQVRASTAACGESCNFSALRYFDVLADGVAHESKVGYVALSDFTRRQVEKDAWLIQNGSIRDAHWHFFASARSNTIGADRRLLDLLDQRRIRYTVHTPR